MTGSAANLPTDAGDAPKPAPDAMPPKPNAIDLKRSTNDHRIGWITAGVCVFLVVLFGTISYRAAMTKSATYDEPLHVVGGFIHRYFHDYRINPEDPALFGMWAAIPLKPAGPGALLTDVTSNKFQLAATDVREQWPFVITSMFQTPNSEGDRALDSARAMFTLLGSVLVAMIAWWGWRLAGGSWKGGSLSAAIGAIVPAALIAFDPNFLAHASLVKNDVPLALLMFAIAYTVWQFGRYGSWWRLLLLTLLIGAAVNVKFSALLLVPIVGLLLFIRALLPPRERSAGQPIYWRTFGLGFTKRIESLVAIVCICFVIAMVMWSITWAVYGFRFNATPDGTPLNFTYFTKLAGQNELSAELLAKGGNGGYTDDQLAAHKLKSLPRLINWTHDRKMLPEGWLFGLLYTYATTLIRSSFLMGESRIHGWWYYFPLAILFKTPVATLIAMFGALVIGLAEVAIPPVGRRMRGDVMGRETSHAFRVATHAPPALGSAGHEAAISATATSTPAAGTTMIGGFDWWSLTCVALPALIYMIAALTTNLNLGLRHVLPVYPFIYLGIGVVAARAARASLKITAIAGGVIVLMLFCEMFVAYPNYLAYFNFPSGGTRGGFKKLGDSNLDWGQDLKLLAGWQQTHRDRPLFTAYFGSADPAFYGVDAGNIILRYPFRPVVDVPNDRPVYLAISATELQHIYAQGDDFGLLRDRVTPIAILGGTIYVYEWPQPGLKNNAAQ